MAKDITITRHIQREVERELWARAAGRCEFNGCNRLLFRSPVTQERVNISEKAHIYSFSTVGPRGQGPLARNNKKLNAIENLILVCHDCHKTIDQDKAGDRYSATLLRAWKEEHERRIAIVTGVALNKKTHVVLYGANIGEQTSKLQPAAAMDALFPDWYPADERPIHLSMTWDQKDSADSYWRTEEENLVALFAQHIKPRVDAADPQHFSIFALAPMPLLMKLGGLLTDKTPAQVYQLHREPQTWRWLDGPRDFAFRIRRPRSTKSPPALVMSLSDRLACERVTSVLGKAVSIWEITIDGPNNDFLRSKDQLSRYRTVMRELIVDIGKSHGKRTPIAIFPAVPVACAVELGRVRMPKADSDWMIYDYNNKHNQFIHAITLGAVS
jgi:hypothetical protein